MNNKKKCQQCSKAFQAKRIDALYCSKACKQNAHYQRATHKIETNSENNTMVFYYDEYKECDIYKGDLDIILFFFIRSKLKETATYKDIEDFIMSHWSEDEYWKRVKNSKAFDDFRERYLNGEFTVLLKRETQ